MKLTFTLSMILCFFGSGLQAADSIWGTHIPGVYDHLKTDQKVIALTFDACGSRGDGFDKELIDYLASNKIPATLFISGLWIKKNPETFTWLSETPIFRIENHGTKHRQLSIDGKGAYNWGKTFGLQEIQDEIQINGETIKRVTGTPPTLFRSGTAHYDLTAVEVIYQLGLRPAGFSHSADGGATFSKKSIVELGVQKATPGGIYLFHMNWPDKSTFEGVRELLPKLRDMGYSFGYLEDYALEQREVRP